MNRPYGGRFAEAAAYILTGSCALHVKGNSLSTPAIDYPYAYALPKALTSRLRPHYFTVPGMISSDGLSNSSGYALQGQGGTPATADSGSGSRTIENYEAPAATPISTKSLWPCRVHVYGSDWGDTSAALGNGIYLSRQIASTPAHTRAQARAMWGTTPDNGGQPWYHGTHIKSKGIIFNGTNPVTRFTVGQIRQGHTTSTNTFSNLVDCTLTGTANTIESTPFSATGASVGQDGGGYDEHASGIKNDHDVGLRFFSPVDGGAAISESGKSLIPMAALFARCDSAGTIPSNADGSRFSYFAGGRTSCYASDWLRYTDALALDPVIMRDWYAASILEANPVCVQFYALDHNINVGSALDLSPYDDGYNSTPEYAANEVTDAWQARYTSLIQFDQASFLAAHPTGRFIPIIIIGHPHVQSGGLAISNQTLITSINNRSKVIAAAVNGGWMSNPEYFRGTSSTWLAPFYNLHPWTEANGSILSDAIMRCLDHATQYQYSPLGRAGGTIIFED